MSSPADLGGTGITEQAVARDILFIGPDESGVDTCAHVQFWRGPSLVPQTLSYQFCIQVSLRTTELSIGPTGVQDLCPILKITRPFPGAIRLPLRRVGTIGV